MRKPLNPKLPLALVAVALLACAPAQERTAAPPPANTPQGTILEVGQAWVREGFALELQAVRFAAFSMEFVWTLTNVSGSTLAIRYNLSRDVSLLAGPDGSRAAVSSVGLGLRVSDAVTKPCVDKAHVLRSGDTLELVCLGSIFTEAPESQRSFVFVKTSDAALPELIVQVDGVVGAAARWRVRLPR